MTSKPVLDGSDLVNPKPRPAQATVGSEGGASQYGSPRLTEEHGDRHASNDIVETAESDNSGSGEAANDDSEGAP